MIWKTLHGKTMKYVSNEEFIGVMYDTMCTFIEDGGTADDIPMQNWVGNMVGIANDLGFGNDMLTEIFAQNNEKAEMFNDLYINFLDRQEKEVG